MAWERKPICFRRSGEKRTQNKAATDKAAASAQIDIHLNTEISEFKGKNNHLETVITKNVQIVASTQDF